MPDKRQKFEIKSFYQALFILTSSPFPYKSIWRVNVPLRVSFFVWMAAFEKILTLDNLRKRKAIVVDWCCMCKRSRKCIDRPFSIVKWQENFGLLFFAFSE
jgi:hypothetical protein